MSTQSCPCCGRAFPKAKAAPVVNVAELSEKDMYAYYKRTAPVENVRFQLRLNLPERIRIEYTTLLDHLIARNGKPDAWANREYLRLQEAWRVWREYREGHERKMTDWAAA